MTSEDLGEMFEGDSAGRAEGLACTDLGARAPIGVIGILNVYIIKCEIKNKLLIAVKMHLDCILYNNIVIIYGSQQISVA